MHCIHCINISVRQIFYTIKIDEVGFSQMATVTIKGNFGLGLLRQSTIFVRVTRQIGQRVQYCIISINSNAIQKFWAEKNSKRNRTTVLFRP